MTHFLDKCLDSKWHWFRVENQKRGAAYSHGCLLSKGDPGIEKWTKIVLKVRTSQKHLEVLNHVQHDHGDYSTENDEWT